MIRFNYWHRMILQQLARSAEPQSPKQIWGGMLEHGFAHESKLPRNTLSARIAELKALGAVEHVAHGLYRKAVSSGAAPYQEKSV